jgi:hypothetical protein
MSRFEDKLEAHVMQQILHIENAYVHCLRVITTDNVRTNDMYM